MDLGPLLRVPLGLRDGGTPLWLGLKEEGDGGNGPHGLLAGTTGSGKSTALQSIVFSLCAQYSPELVQVMLIYTKDRSSFDDFTVLPAHRDRSGRGRFQVHPAGSDLPALPGSICRRCHSHGWRGGAAERSRSGYR